MALVLFCFSFLNLYPPPPAPKVISIDSVNGERLCDTYLSLCSVLTGHHSTDGRRCSQGTVCAREPCGERQG